MKLISLLLYYLLCLLLNIIGETNSILNKDLSPSYVTNIIKSNKFIYDFTINNKKRNLFIDKTIKLINKLHKLESIQTYLFIFPKKSISLFHALAEYNKYLYLDLLNSTKIIKTNSTILITITNDEKDCDIFFSNSKVNNLFSEKELIKIKRVAIEDMYTGGSYYSSFYLLKYLYSKLVDVKPSRVKHYTTTTSTTTINQNSNSYQNEKAQIIKSLFMLPIIILICYSYFSGRLFINNYTNQLDLTKIKIEKIDLKDIIDKSCIICIEDFIQKKILKQSDTETILLVKEKYYPNKIMKLECGHLFHPTCIVKWIHKQKKCPTCRKEIEKETINLYQIG